MKNLLLAALLALPVAAQAAAYRVDLIVFLDKDNPRGAAGELTAPPAAPDFSHAIELDNAATLKSAGIALVPDSEFGLADAWAHLRNSRRYAPLLRVAWVQQDPPSADGPALRLHEGELIQIPPPPDLAAPAFSVYRLDGTVTLLLSRYLHLDVDLAYTEPLGDGQVGSFRLRESRRMKSGETHHLDSPRLGVLARVTRASP